MKTGGQELPDRCFEEAGRLAAYYSKARGAEKVEIDYLERKNVKKPNGSKPGFVIFTNQKTYYATPDAQKLEKYLK